MLACCPLLSYFCMLCALLSLLWFVRRVVNNVRVPAAGKTVVITGCDTGFGNLLAKRLDGMGVKVYALCLTKSGASALQKECSGNLSTYVADVTDKKAVEAFAQKVSTEVDAGDGVWAVVNNAGIASGTQLHMTEVEDFEKVMAVNYFGTLYMCKHFIPLVMKARGRFVNVASVAGRIGMAGGGGYCASKHAVEGFSDSLRFEMAQWGCQVVVIEPSFMATPLVGGIRDQFMKIWNAMPQEKRDMYGDAYLQDQLKMVDLCQTKAHSPSLTIDNLERAILARTPPSRILSGPDAPVFALMAMLPTELQAYCNLVLMGRRLRPAAATH